MENHLVHSPLLSESLEEIIQQVFGGGGVVEITVV